MFPGNAYGRSAALLAGGLGFGEDEIHHGLRVLRADGEMSLALLDDDRDLTAELLVSLLNNAALAVKPGVEAAANMEDGHAGFGQRGQIIDRRFFALSSGGRVPSWCCEGGDSGRRCTKLCPDFRWPMRRLRPPPAPAFHRGFLGEAVVGHGLIDGVPLFPQTGRIGP